MAKWLKSSNKHISLSGNFEILPFSNSDFLIVSTEPKRKARGQITRPGVYRYNIWKNSYQQIIDFKSCRIPIPSSVTIDSKSQIIYGQFAEESSLSLWKLDLNELDWDEIADLSNTSFYNAKQIIYANGNIHIIEAGFDYKHFIADECNNQAIYKHNIGEIQNEGRSTNRHWGDTVSLSYLDKPSQSILAKPEFSNFICQYSVANDKWIKWDIFIPIELHGAEIIHTQSEPYLLLIPPRGHIWIIDMETKTLKETEVKVSDAGYVFKGIIMKCEERDTKLCWAFVNVLYRNKKYENVQRLPNYMIKLIRNFVSIETLHLLSNQGHWQISLDAILSNIV